MKKNPARQRIAAIMGAGTLTEANAWQGVPQMLTDLKSIRARLLSIKQFVGDEDDNDSLAHAVNNISNALLGLEAFNSSPTQQRGR